MLNKEEEIEIEHIWSNHYEEHVMNLRILMILF